MRQTYGYDSELREVWVFDGKPAREEWIKDGILAPLATTRRRIFGNDPLVHRARKAHQLHIYSTGGTTA